MSINSIGSTDDLNSLDVVSYQINHELNGLKKGIDSSKEEDPLGSFNNYLGSLEFMLDTSSPKRKLIFERSPVELHKDLLSMVNSVKNRISICRLSVENVKLHGSQLTVSDGEVADVFKAIDLGKPRLITDDQINDIYVMLSKTPSNNIEPASLKKSFIKSLKSLRFNSDDLVSFVIEDFHNMIIPYGYGVPLDTENVLMEMKK